MQLPSDDRVDNGMVRIGTAGWAIRREYAACFPGTGSHLARYATRLNAVEINSSFYRPHRPSTYARWARETPQDFAFSVKMPRAITHEARLKETGAALAEFFAQCGALGDKLGCVLIQLPPNLAFDATVVREFFEAFRGAYSDHAVLEPRNASWFAKKADAMLARFRIARVGADPIPAKMKEISGAATPGGFEGFQYWRLHGSPKIYYSNYDDAFLRALARRLTGDAWVIFDNTAQGCATTNALSLRKIVRSGE
jgi:uncharacterized protein YecE (DUF72 family)